MEIQEDAILQFCDITGSTPDVAKQYLTVSFCSSALKIDIIFKQ